MTYAICMSWVRDNQHRAEIVGYADTASDAQSRCAKMHKIAERKDVQVFYWYAPIRALRTRITMADEAHGDAA